MRILLVHNCYQQKGGEDVVVDSECQLLKSYGHEVSIVHRINLEISKVGIIKKIIVLLKSKWNNQSAEWVVEKARAFKADIVHVHNFWFMLSPAIFFALHEAGFPVVLTLHNYRLLCLNGMLLRNRKICEDCLNSNLFKGVSHRCYKSSILQSYLVYRMVSHSRKLKVWEKYVNGFICLTEHSKAMMVRCGMPEEKIFVRSNFIYRNESVSAHRDGSALFVGRLSEEKGVELLLNASRHISCKIIVAGDGPLKNRLEDIPNVKFVGWQDKLSVQALMRKSSMLIFPSIWYEGMPMTILEAFSVGLPVVASRIGGIPEIVMDGENGLLFEPGDDIDLAMKINLLSSNLELQGRLSSEAQKKYEDTYSPAANYSKILPIYDTVISEKRQMR